MCPAAEDSPKATQMDVRCERCNTEYEFDDALVSGRGTTVKCTNCGHKFKIRRGDGDFTEDFWNVTTGAGKTLVFTSLRELQRAIHNQLVDRSDKLSRGGRPPKAIGQIPELLPFFEQRDQARANAGPARERMDTLGGLAPPPPTSAQMRSSRPPPPPGAKPPTAEPPEVRKRQSTRPFERGSDGALQAASPLKSTLIGPASTSTEAAAPVAEAPPPEPAVAAPLSAEEAPKTEREPSPSTERYSAPTPSAPATPPALPPRATPSPAPSAALNGNRTVPLGREVAAARRLAAPAVLETSSPLPPPTQVVRRQLLADEDDDDDDEPVRRARSDAPASMGRRRSVGGFVVAAVVAASVAVVAVVWLQKHGMSFDGSGTPAPSATTDPRALAFLSTGEKALADGNLELAKESFDKASALAEKDPHVLLDVARLAATRADTLWLKSRLLPADAKDEHHVTAEALKEQAANARKAADDALAVAPDDPAALRAKIDALRISGDRGAARPLVDKIRSSAEQPESAYVLAALDLAEPQPLWSTVVERLKLAAAAESGPGRARAALVYALARSGDVAGARAELDRLTALSRPHPLLPQLRGFVDDAKASEADAGPGLADAGAVVAAGDGTEPKPAHAGGADESLPRDPRVLVAQGEKARIKGDYDRARRLYSAALEHNANDSEALSGLASIAYAQHDLAGARLAYKRVLAVNPNYTPALVGLGDVEWEAGDRSAAAKLYKDIVDRYPDGTYPARVRQRAESAASAPAPSSAPSPSGDQGGQ